MKNRNKYVTMEVHSERAFSEKYGEKKKIYRHTHTPTNEQ